MTSFIITEHISSEYEIKKSKFIAHITPVKSKEEALNFIKKIKEEYKDASHNVPCYIIGENANEKWSSDDGEPGGSSGLPILSILLKMNIINIAVVVTRYFGGIKLGTSGLARAYPKAVRLALDKVEKKPYIKYKTENIILSYSEFEKYKRKLEKKGGEILDIKFGDKVDLTVKIPDF